MTTTGVSSPFGPAYAGSAISADGIVRDIVSTVTAMYDPYRIVLFGSRARGTARDTSDFDILVVVDQACNEAELEIAVTDALGSLPAPKDVIVYSQQSIDSYGAMPGSILYKALLDGVTIYERTRR